MKSKRFHFLVIPILAIFWLQPLTGKVFATAKESLLWKTQESEHFLIHYHQGEALLSLRIAGIAEKIHANLSNYFNWSPRDRTHLILSDQYDEANGSATSFPRNKIFLRMASPDDILGTEDYLDRLTSLLTHEYAHILHIDKIGDRAKIKRDILGRFLISFPAIFQPNWAIEGLATHLETNSSLGIGRGQSSYYRMLMRMEVLAGIKPFEQVNQPIESWPGGTTPYLYGVYFYKFLNETYGEESIKKWIAGYNNTIIPFQINGIARDVFGKSLAQLWEEFERYLNSKFSTELDRVRKKGLKMGQPLTHFGSRTTNPRLGGKNDLYFIKDDPIEGPVLMKSKGDIIETLLNVRGRRIDFHSESGFLIIQNTPFGKIARFDDIYKISGDDFKITRLTTGGRYTFASWHPKGNKIIAVQNRLGRSSLHLLDASGQLLQILWEGKESEVISSPDWSPTGEFIVAAIKRPSATWNLEMFGIQNRSWVKITNNRFVEGQPHFGKSGEKIYYSAEYDGIYNIYSLNLKNKKISRISNVLGGAFYPQVSDDGKKLVYKGANKNGFDIYQMPVIEESFTVQSIKTIPGPNRQKDLSEFTEEAASSDYNPALDLFPTWWFPYLFITNSQKMVGLITSTSDPLLHHQIDLILAYESQNQLPLWGFSYSYDAMRPTFQFVSRRQYSTLYDSSDTLSSIRAETETSLFSVLRFPGLYTSWSLTGGVTQIDERDHLIFSGGEDFAKKDNMLGVSVSLSSLYGGSRSINFTEGFYGTLSYVDSEILKGDYRGKTLIFEQGVYKHLGGNHIISEHFAAGSGSRTGRPFVLNSGIPLLSKDPRKQTSKSNLLLNNGPFSRRKYSLRGYEEDSSKLTGERFLYSSLVWHFPVWLVERGLTAPPVGIHQFHGALFLNFGDAWQDESENFDLHRSVGVEFTAETVLGYQLPFNIRVGIVRGLDEGGGLSWFLSFDNLI